MEPHFPRLGTDKKERVNDGFLHSEAAFYVPVEGKKSFCGLWSNLVGAHVDGSHHFKSLQIALNQSPKPNPKHNPLGPLHFKNSTNIRLIAFSHSAIANR